MSVRYAATGTLARLTSGGRRAWRRSSHSLLRHIFQRPRGQPGHAAAAYVVFNEQLWHPLLRSQVLDLLLRLRPRLGDRSLYLLAFVPSREAALRRKEIDEVAAELAVEGVLLAVQTLPPLPLPRPPFTRVWGIWTPHESRRAMPLARVLVGIAVARLRYGQRVTLFHARSYPAATAVAPAARLIGARLIFDTRSPFPEENVVAGRWAADSPDLAYWKKHERLLLRGADVTVAISPEHERHIRREEATARTVVVPNNVEVERFAAAGSQRAEVRRSLDVGPEEVLLCYLGSLNRTWNDPAIYARFYGSLAGWRRPHRLFLIVPQHDHPLVRSAFEAASLREGADFLLVHASPAEVPRWLSGADVGLQLFAAPDSRIGVKVVEYLASGLPVVTNRNVSGAATLVEEEGVGIVLDDIGPGISARLDGSILSRRAELRQRCVALARSRFSTDRVAEQYAAIYRELLGG